MKSGICKDYASFCSPHVPLTDLMFDVCCLGILKKMKENSTLKDLCPKKIINQSARKTMVKKLKNSGIPKCAIKNTADHMFAQGLDYDSGDQ